MIERISLRDVLPAVFESYRGASSLAESHIWLRDVDFLRGHSYTISADSGMGKSSLCSFVYGNRCDYSGKILFDGQDSRTFGIGRWCELRRVSLALLPQEMRLFPELTAMENIRLKNELTGFRSEQQIMAMLDELGIAEKASMKVATLSIGQQQRVALVRTLCQPCDFILLDEPVSHLDEKNNAIVAAMIEREAAAQGAGIIATSVGYNLALNSFEELKL